MAGRAERRVTLMTRLRYPALGLWRAELRAGIAGQRLNRSSSWRTDALWRAAAWEAAAREAEWAGQLDTWRNAMGRAREAVAEAALKRSRP